MNCGGKGHFAVVGKTGIVTVKAGDLAEQKIYLAVKCVAIFFGKIGYKPLAKLELFPCRRILAEIGIKLPTVKKGVKQFLFIRAVIALF